MSLVGPRPEQPAFVQQFRTLVPRYMERHHEKAGMTGWAQVNGLRGDTSIYERTKYDLWYIENWSVWLDVKILIRTLVRFWYRPLMPTDLPCPNWRASPPSFQPSTMPAPSPAW